MSTIHPPDEAEFFKELAVELLGPTLTFRLWHNDGRQIPLPPVIVRLEPDGRGRIPLSVCFVNRVTRKGGPPVNLPRRFTMTAHRQDGRVAWRWPDLDYGSDVTLMATESLRVETELTPRPVSHNEAPSCPA